MFEMFVLPTGLTDREGNRLMLRGSLDEVHGLTPRLLWDDGSASYRLWFKSDGALAGTYTNGYRHEHTFALDADSSVELSEGRSVRLMRLPFGMCRITLTGSAWKENAAHAGIVPCAACAEPISTEPEGKNGLHCDNPGCHVSPVRQLNWTDLLALSAGGKGPFSDGFRINTWRGVLNTRGR